MTRLLVALVILASVFLAGCSQDGGEVHVAAPNSDGAASQKQGGHQMSAPSKGLD